MHGQGGGQGPAEPGDHGNEAESRARRLDQTAVFIGAVVAIATLAIGAGLLYFLLNENDGDTTRADAAAATKKQATATTGASGSTTTATGGAGAAGALPATGAAGPGSATTPTTAPPTPMATADPTDDPYVAKPLPPGTSVTLTSCRWEPANGGQFEASGTLTSATDDAWIVTAYWLQNQRELAETDSDFLDFDEVPGTTKTWQLTATAPLPPADLTCAVEVF